MTMTPTDKAKKNTAQENSTDAQGLSPAVQTTMLLVRWEIAVRARAWWAADAIAKELIEMLPDEPIGWLYHAFAQQQSGELQKGRRILLTGARKFPKDWRIAYNLACCNARLGDVAGAWNWLERAFELGDAAVIKRLAGEESSLRPLLERAVLEYEPFLRRSVDAHYSETEPAGFAV